MKKKVKVEVPTNLTVDITIRRGAQVLATITGPANRPIDWQAPLADPPLTEEYKLWAVSYRPITAKNYYPKDTEKTRTSTTDWTNLRPDGTRHRKDKTYEGTSVPKTTATAAK